MSLALLGATAPAWGEFVSGGSPKQDLQPLALHLPPVPNIQILYGFSLTFIWVPRDQNVCADYLVMIQKNSKQTAAFSGRNFEIIFDSENVHERSSYETAFSILT
jgi:hypothetical protein